MPGDTYSRTISFLKVMLPLIALGILSTLFLVSRVVSPTATVPFADADVQQRLTNQRISGPYFSGTTAGGDEIAFIAERLDSPDGTIGANKAEDVLVQVDFASGSNMMVEADVAMVDLANDTSELIGNVEVVTSHGYRIQSEKLLIKVSTLDVTSPDFVTGQSPLGDLEAGQMRFIAPTDNAEAQIFFTNGVKLLYQPTDGTK